MWYPNHTFCIFSTILDSLKKYSDLRFLAKEKNQIRAIGEVFRVFYAQSTPRITPTTSIDPASEPSRFDAPVVIVSIAGGVAFLFILGMTLYACSVQKTEKALKDIGKIEMAKASDTNPLLTTTVGEGNGGLLSSTL